jgi:purine-binding chemotaxis protein CheW
MQYRQRARRRGAWPPWPPGGRRPVRVLAQTGGAGTAVGACRGGTKPALASARTNPERTDAVKTTLITFTLAGERFAVDAAAVHEVVRAVAVTRLPGAPAVVAGVIDVRGETVPVFDTRLRFGLPSRPVEPAEHFILVSAGERTAALRADTTGWLEDVPAAAIRRAPLAAAAPHVAGTAALEDGLVLIHDVATFLSRAEAETLDAALRDHAGAPASPARG